MTRNRLGEPDKPGLKPAEQEELLDLLEVDILEELPREERMRAFLRQIKNPCRFRCGDVPVTIRFTGDGPAFGEAVLDYFLTLRQGL